MARIGEEINAYMVLLGKPEGRKQLGSPRIRWQTIHMPNEFEINRMGRFLIAIPIMSEYFPKRHGDSGGSL